MVIVDIDTESIAAQAGIEKGDVILQINDQEITDINSFYEIINNLKNNKKYIFLIYRRGTMFLLSIRK